MAVRRRARTTRRKAAGKGGRRRKPAAKPGRKRARAAAPKPRLQRSRAAAKPAPARAPATPNAIGCVHTHLDYTTHSIEDMKHFYTEVLGFADANWDPRFEYLLVRTGPSSSLGFMAPMPGPPEQWRPPREAAIYLHVSDVNLATRELKARGVSFQQEPADMPWGHRVAILKDPEGRQIFLAQPIAP